MVLDLYSTSHAEKTSISFSPFELGERHSTVQYGTVGYWREGGKRVASWRLIKG